MGVLCSSSCGKQGKSKVYSISKIKTGTNQLSSIVPSAHGAKPTLGKQKKLRSTKSRTREQVSELRTGPSPRKTPNPRIHGTLRAPRKPIVGGK